MQFTRKTRLGNTRVSIPEIILNIVKYLFLGVVGGLIYVTVELLFRGYSHVSMFFVGGACFLLVGLVNEVMSWDTALISQMFISALVITCVELIAGSILNIWLGLNVWDYSHMPYNLKGQICLLFSCGWFLLSLPAILLDDWIRYAIFNERKPKYKIL